MLPIGRSEVVPIRVQRLPQSIETPVAFVSTPGAYVRYAYARSSDSMNNHADGQDYLCFQHNDQRLALRPPEERAAPGHGSNDAAGFAEHVQLRSERVAVGEKIVNDVSADQTNGSVLVLFGLCVEAAQINFDTFNVE